MAELPQETIYRIKSEAVKQYKSELINVVKQLKNKYKEESDGFTYIGKEEAIDDVLVLLGANNERT